MVNSCDTKLCKLTLIVYLFFLIIKCYCKLALRKNYVFRFINSSTTVGWSLFFGDIHLFCLGLVDGSVSNVISSSLYTLLLKFVSLINYITTLMQNTYLPPVSRPYITCNVSSTTINYNKSHLSLDNQC